MNTLQKLPRIDLHRHFGGSLSVGFVWNTIRSLNLPIADSYSEVRSKMVYEDHEPRDFYRFLDKFRLLDDITWTEELIDQSILDVCNGLVIDKIDYTWLRFSINKYLNHISWTPIQAIKFVNDSFNRHGFRRVDLILSLKYESNRDEQRSLAKLIENSDVADCVKGIDLVGDESKFDSGFYGSLLADWHKANKLVFAHVGESQSGDNIKAAIKEMYVTEISHGIKADDYTIALAKDYNACFHMALSSNILTGVSTVHDHPITKFIEAGVNTTIGTDDPIQCNTTLDGEFALLCEILNRNEYSISGAQSVCTRLRQTALDRSIKHIVGKT